MISIIIALLVIGVALYLLTIIPMDETIKQVIRVLVILCVVIWVLSLVLHGGIGYGLAGPCR